MEEELQKVKASELAICTEEMMLAPDPSGKLVPVFRATMQLVPAHCYTVPVVLKSLQYLYRNFLADLFSRWPYTAIGLHVADTLGRYAFVLFPDVVRRDRCPGCPPCDRPMPAAGTQERADLLFCHVNNLMQHMGCHVLGISSKFDTKGMTDICKRLAIYVSTVELYGGNPYGAVSSARLLTTRLLEGASAIWKTMDMPRWYDVMHWSVILTKLALAFFKLITLPFELLWNPETRDVFEPLVFGSKSISTVRTSVDALLSVGPVEAGEAMSLYLGKLTAYLTQHALGIAGDGDAGDKADEDFLAKRTT